MPQVFNVRLIGERALAATNDLLAEAGYGVRVQMMNAEDFEDDKKDAGELGAGHTVTAIYEIVPGKSKKTDLKYQDKSTNPSNDLATIKLRYKKPDENTSILKEVIISKDAAKKMGSNIAHFDRFVFELKLFKDIVTIPTLVIGIK